MRASPLALSPRMMRLAVSGSAVTILAYCAASTVAGMLDAGDQVADLKASYASLVEQGAAAKLEAPSSGPIPRRALIASGKEAAVSLIQHTIQQSVEAPARLESLHILDAPDEKGLVVVRASLRIRGLAPERVAGFVRRIEGTVPAILFDDLRVSVHTKPGVFGTVGPAAGVETNSVELGGVVRAYAMGAADRLPSGAAERQSR